MLSNHQSLGSFASCTRRYLVQGLEANERHLQASGRISMYTRKKLQYSHFLKFCACPRPSVTVTVMVRWIWRRKSIHRNLSRVYCLDCHHDSQHVGGLWDLSMQDLRPRSMRSIRTVEALQLHPHAQCMCAYMRCSCTLTHTYVDIRINSVKQTEFMKTVLVCRVSYCYILLSEDTSCQVWFHAMFSPPTMSRARHISWDLSLQK